VVREPKYICGAKIKFAAALGGGGFSISAGCPHGFQPTSLLAIGHRPSRAVTTADLPFNCEKI